MDPNVKALNAVEILDSRGNPTLAVTVTLSDGTTAAPGCPRAHRRDHARPSSSATATQPATTARAC